MLGLMARVAPQMNVFVVGFPIQITIGLIMLIVSLPLLGAVFPALVDTLAAPARHGPARDGPAGSPSPLPSPTP